jgi:5-hydroxyisourate hydrolase-like protein (transthyretin family)
MADFYIKQGDTSPSFEVTLLDADRVAVDLTGATVQFRMSTRAGVAPVIDELADIISAADGRVAYNWVAGDTDDAGTYLAEFVITDPYQETFPNTRYLTVEIKPNLAAPVAP